MMVLISSFQDYCEHNVEGAFCWGELSNYWATELIQGRNARAQNNELLHKSTFGGNITERPFCG